MTQQTDALLERCRQAQTSADKATAELAEAVRLHSLNRLADRLEAEHGACQLNRANLIEFLADQVERIKGEVLSDSTAAAAMIDRAYLDLLSHHD